MIPLSIPNLCGNELKYLEQCIKTGWISSAGSFVDKFEDKIAHYTSSKYSIACMNGTVGLHTSLLLLNVRANDIVLTTNLTFVATLNAISYTGATPMLFDIDERTWQINLKLVEEWLEENTILSEFNGQVFSFSKLTGQRIAAILPVHVLGGLVDVEKLEFISSKYKIPILEDSTEALGSSFKSQFAGTFGDIGVFSFNGNKIISTGGGGMIVTNDEELARKAKHLTTTAKTDPLDYFHDEVGYNYRLVNVLAAIGVAQMENLDKILERKKMIDEVYKEELKNIDEVVFQQHIPNSKPNNWLFTFRTTRMKNLLKYLNNNKIQSRPFWTPMNLLPMYSKLNYVTELNIVNKIFSECISIPSSSNLTEGQQDQVIQTIKKFFKK